MAAPAPSSSSGYQDGVEVEWQFDALDLRPVERWLASLPVRLDLPGQVAPSLTALTKPTRRLVDRYLDTDDWRVGRAGFVLRTRRRGRSDEATLKDRASAGESGLRQRLEVTEQLPAAGIGALGTEGPVGWRLAAVAGSRPLHQVLEVRTRRRPFSLKVAGEEVAEVALDETTIVVGGDERPVQLRRVEVEVDPAWVDRLEPVVEDLRTSCGLQSATLSKFEAGLMALGITIPTPPDLGSTQASADATFGELAYAVVRKHLGALIAREPGTRLGEDVEELHDMRVATRRLRAAMDLFAEVLPVRAVTWRDELRWLAGVLGGVRDLDVQLERMDEMDEWARAFSDQGDQRPLDELRRLLEAERTAARTELLAALDSARYERLIAGLTGLAQRGPTRRVAATRAPAVVLVPDLVLERHRAVDKGARRARRSGIPADFHRLRIRGKRLRYSLEFTAALYGSRTERFVRQLARLQDSLGLMQDAEVATTRLLALATESGHPLPPATVFAMGGVAERYRVEAEELLHRLPQGLKVVHGKEWRDLSDLMARRRQSALAALAVPRPRPAAPAGRPPAAAPPATPGPEAAPVASGADQPSAVEAGIPAPVPSETPGAADDAHEAQAWPTWPAGTRPAEEAPVVAVEPATQAGGPVDEATVAAPAHAGNGSAPSGPAFGPLGEATAS